MSLNQEKLLAKHSLKELFNDLNFISYYHYLFISKRQIFILLNFTIYFLKKMSLNYLEI
jgi:hypothetical protein